MDIARYYVALIIVVLTPGAFLFWFSIHPFIKFWRRIGVRQTLVIHYSLMVILAVIIFLVRESILSIEFGSNPLLIVAAAVFLMGSITMRVQLSKQLKTKVLMGLPELAPDKYPNRLITEGIYARIRHPRYVQLLLAILAHALFSNYLAVYVFCVIGLVWMVLVAQLEEKELRVRFGEQYGRYCEQVPRFIPKL